MEDIKSNQKYILDNNALIKIQELLSYGQITLSQVENMVIFFKEYVNQTIPFSLLDEYKKNKFADFKAGSRIDSTPPLTVEVTNDGIMTTYCFDGVSNRGCMEVQIAKEGQCLKKIQPADVEIIARCVIDDSIFVSEDLSAKYLAKCLAIKTIGFEDFINKIGIKIN